MCNIVPSHIEFHSEYIRIFVPRSKTVFIGRVIMSISDHWELHTAPLVF